MKNIQKQLILEELSLEAMTIIKGGDHSHDLVILNEVIGNYGTGGSPPIIVSMNDGQ